MSGNLQRRIRRAGPALLTFLLTWPTGCQKLDRPSVPLDPVAGMRAGATQVFSGASQRFPGGSPASGQSFSKSMESMAEALEELPAEDDQQKVALSKAIGVVQQSARRYAQLVPGMAPAGLKIWLVQRETDRESLKKAGLDLIAAGLSSLGQAIRELGLRREVLVFRRLLPKSTPICLNPQVDCDGGGLRHAYLTAASSDALAELRGYRFLGVAFQIFEAPLTTRGHSIQQPLYQCRMQVTEAVYYAGGFLAERRDVPLYFLDTSSECQGHSLVTTLGYVASQAGTAATRPLHWLVRMTGPRGKEDSDYTDSITVPDLGWAQQVVSGSGGQYFSFNDFTPLGFVP